VKFHYLRFSVAIWVHATSYNWHLNEKTQSITGAEQINVFSKMCVGRTVAAYTKGPWFKSFQRQLLEQLC